MLALCWEGKVYSLACLCSTEQEVMGSLGFSTWIACFTCSWKKSLNLSMRIFLGALLTGRPKG
jgi:hypothetical protein